MLWFLGTVTDVYRGRGTFCPQLSLKRSEVGILAKQVRQRLVDRWLSEALTMSVLISQILHLGRMTFQHKTILYNTHVCSCSGVAEGRGGVVRNKEHACSYLPKVWFVPN